jgi:hypothetical protein
MNRKDHKLPAAEKDNAQKDDLSHDEAEAPRQAAHEAKIEELKAKAREIVERVMREEERRKRGKPKK